MRRIGGRVDSYDEPVAEGEKGQIYLAGSFWNLGSFHETRNMEALSLC
jgi:hypothetical protein